jgi:hypothetical protein
MVALSMYMHMRCRLSEHDNTCVVLGRLAITLLSVLLCRNCCHELIAYGVSGAHGYTTCNVRGTRAML